jgi:hypothetical protein
MYYNYRVYFDNQAYPHTVNLTKININNKYLFLSTGHSFPELRYTTNDNIDIYRTMDINEMFSNPNKYYSIDDNFNDFALLNILTNDNKQYIQINNTNFEIIGICKNTNIKFLENEILVKNSFSTGLTFTRPIINFDTDQFIESKNNNMTYYTFKINGKIVIISTPYKEGIIVKGCSSSLDLYNGIAIEQNEINKQLEYYYNNIISTFKNHELLYKLANYDPTIFKQHFNYYKTNNLITIVSLMGDSGAGFYRMIPNSTNLETVGINICGCSIIVLSQDGSTDKIKIGNYWIDELHKGAQLLSINKINTIISQNNMIII